MSKKKKQNKKTKANNMRLNPEKRMCSEYDAYSMAKYPVAKPGVMGVRVVDNCAEEHIM